MLILLSTIKFTLSFFQIVFLSRSQLFSISLLTPWLPWKKNVQMQHFHLCSLPLGVFCNPEKAVYPLFCMWNSRKKFPLCLSTTPWCLTIYWHFKHHPPVLDDIYWCLDTGGGEVGKSDVKWMHPPPNP